MTRPSSPNLQGYLDSSSLDPLAISFGDENVDPQAFDQSLPTRLPRSSPQKAMRIVEDISLSSPHGLKRRTSQALSSLSKKVSYQNLSPWKIRVTVEAEPEEMRIPNDRTTARTSKVPLREDSPDTGVVRGRGRRSGVRSSGTKRRSTPVRGARSTSRSRRQSVTNLDITVLGDDDDLDEWSPRKSKKRGRPRGKKSERERERQAVPDITSDGQVDDGAAAENGRDISEGPGFEIMPDSDAGNHVPIPAEVEEDSPQLREIDLNRVSVRSKSGPPKGRKSRCQKDNAGTCSAAVLPPDLTLETEHVLQRSMANSYPTPTSSIQGDSDDVQNVTSDPTEHREGFDTILESEGFTMIDLESISSTRNFVSPPPEQDREKAGQIETLAHNSNNDISLSEPPPPTNLSPASSPVTQNQPRPQPTAIPSSLTLAEGDSDLSSTVPSSPPVLAQTLFVPPSNVRSPQAGLTPQPYSSPRLPSPRASAVPNPPQVARTQTSTPPKLAHVVQAGIALQGVLSPRATSSKPEAKGPVIARGTPKQRPDDLFEGFDSGTRRELRAGLRFGEELAKRQKSSSPAELQKQPAKASSSTQVWRGETTVQHTPITLLSNVTDMVEKHACPTATTPLVETKRLKGVENTSYAGLTTPLQDRNQASTSAYLNTQAKEREWQLEREAVSKQIENASTSQVIFIDSDEIEADTDRLVDNKQLSPSTGSDKEKDRDVDETDGDIWLAEAEAHNSSQHQTDGPAPDLFPASEQGRQRERAREVVNKPRRGLIPSPWKRGEDIDGASTIMSNGDVSGLLWNQPSSSARFGAGAIKRQMQGKSNAFGSASSKPDTPLRLRRDTEDAKWVLNSNERDFSSVTHEIVEEDERDDDMRLHETLPEQEERNAENDVTQSLVDESACESNDEDEPGAGEDSRGETTSGQDTSPLPPQPIKIPVKFNDSTTSAPPLTPSFLSNTPQSSRPSTPRSALKGSRLSRGLEDASERKVVFSSHSFCVDESGQKSNSRIKSLSPTPPPSTIPGVVECLQPALPPATLSGGKPDPGPMPQPESAPKPWFGWFFGGGKTSSPTPTPPPTLVAVSDGAGIAAVDGVRDNVNADPGWVATKSSIVSCRRSSLKGKRRLPSFLRPPSYPSDPTRDVSVPLATSGEFTDVHFRTLHIIYRKSLRRSFHAPDAIRPGLQKTIGAKFDCDEGEYGYFAWEVDHDAVVVLERFMQEVELGWDGKRNVKWDWSEKELCGRLFRIIVGEEVRREQSWKREQDREEKKEKN
jgi:hypothetical protein